MHVINMHGNIIQKVTCMIYHSLMHLLVYWEKEVPVPSNGQQYDQPYQLVLKVLTNRNNVTRL